MASPLGGALVGAEFGDGEDVLYNFAVPCEPMQDEPLLAAPSATSNRSVQFSNSVQQIEFVINEDSSLDRAVNSKELRDESGGVTHLSHQPVEFPKQLVSIEQSMEQEALAIQRALQLRFDLFGEALRVSHFEMGS